jgi:hypothetical protein
MNEMIVGTAIKALEQGDLLHARDLAIQALDAEGPTIEVIDLIGKVDSKLKKNGFIENSVDMIDRLSRATSEAGIQIVLNIRCKELESEAWPMARKDAKHTSCSLRFGDSRSLRFKTLWSYSFPHGPIPIEGILDIPASIIANDHFVAPTGNLQGFIGLELTTGRILWESGPLASKLDFSMSPAYIKPHIYFFSEGVCKRIQMSESTAEVIQISSAMRLLSYSAPITWRNSLVAAFIDHLFIYNPGLESGTLYPLNLREGEFLRMPTVSAGNLYLFTNKGRIYILPSSEENQEIVLIKEFPWSDAINSTPCVLDEKLYFESVNTEGRRRLCCYLPLDDRLFFHELRDEFCRTDHSHLDYPAVACKDGVLFTSDTHRRLYKVMQTGELLEAVPINTYSPSENGGLTFISQFFSTTFGSFFISKSHGGFVAISLINGDARTEFFSPHRWEMISQPVFYGSKALFFCREGIKCYEVC